LPVIRVLSASKSPAFLVGIRNSELKNCTHNRADEKRTDVSQSEHEASGPGHEGKYRQTCQE
jgi:hypothetical protein